MLKACEAARQNKWKILKSALNDIEKLIQLQKTKFQAELWGLQAYCAQAIESYLQLVVHKNYKGIPASETAAEVFGFVKKWGGWQVQ